MSTTPPRVPRSPKHQDATTKRKTSAVMRNRPPSDRTVRSRTDPCCLWTPGAKESDHTQHPPPDNPPRPPNRQKRPFRSSGTGPSSWPSPPPVEESSCCEEGDPLSERVPPHPGRFCACTPRACDLRTPTRGSHRACSDEHTRNI